MFPTTSVFLLCLQLDSGKKQKGLLAERIADMELAAAAGEGDIRRARAELAELQVRLWLFGYF
jgi:hypothetical protein